MVEKTPEKKQNWFARTSKRLGRWLREMRSELKKVVWPTFGQVVNNSGIVIALVIIVAIFTALVDLGFNTAVRGIISISHGNEPVVAGDTGADAGDLDDLLANLDLETTAADTTAADAEGNS